MYNCELWPASTKLHQILPTPSSGMLVQPHHIQNSWHHSRSCPLTIWNGMPSCFFNLDSLLAWTFINSYPASPPPLLQLSYEIHSAGWKLLYFFLFSQDSLCSMEVCMYESGRYNSFLLYLVIFLIWVNLSFNVLSLQKSLIDCFSNFSMKPIWHGVPLNFTNWIIYF